MDRNGTDKPEASAARPRENVARESASPGGQDGGPDNQAGCDRTRPSALQTVRIPRRAGNRTLVPSRRCTRERCSCEKCTRKVRACPSQRRRCVASIGRCRFCRQPYAVAGKTRESERSNLLLAVLFVF